MGLLIQAYVFLKSLFTSSSEEPTSEKPNFLLPLNIQFFADGDDPEGDEEEDDADDEEEKPFAQFKTKDELNKRLSRAEKSGKKALAKELGFDSIEAMMAAHKKPVTKVDEKDKTKDQVDVDKIVEDKLKDMQAKGFKRILNAEVKIFAKELGFADHEDALALADLSEVKENDNGDLEGVEDALKALAVKKPHLLKTAPEGGFGADIKNKRKNEKDNLENIKKLAQSRGTQTTTVNDPWKR